MPAVIEKAIAFSAGEWDLLAGLPFMQRCLYLVLRWYMDRNTGRVGEARGISLQGLAEELYVEPVRGRHAADCGSPSKKAIRSALDALERARLIQSCGNGEVLVFFLPAARRFSARPKDDGHMRGTDEGHDERKAKSRAVAGSSTHEGRDEGHTQSADEGHTSRERVNHPSKQTMSTATRPVDKKLSTEPALLLPLLPEMVAGWLRWKERQRGCRAKIVSSAPQIAAWVAQGVLPEQLAEAYALAVDQRELAGSEAPINVGFVDVFLVKVLAAGVVSRKATGPIIEPWKYSFEGLNERAGQLGIDRWNGADDFEVFQARVLAAHGAALAGSEVGNG